MEPGHCLIKQMIDEVAMERGSFDVYLNPDKAWAFTVKKLGSNLVQIGDYSHVLALYNRLGDVRYAEYEIDSNDKLHVHGIIMLQKGFLRKRLCLQGFHVKLEEIYDENSWLRYINKTKPMYNNNQYMF